MTFDPRAIKGVDMEIRKTPGTTLRNDRTRQLIYTPPEGEVLLREKLANWEQWMHGSLPGTADIDPLVRMAAGHYQLFVRPYCRIAHAVEAGLAKRQTASTYLKELTAIGILREHKMGREKLFLNPAFIDLLKRD